MDKTKLCAQTAVDKEDVTTEREVVRITRQSDCLQGSGTNCKAVLYDFCSKGRYIGPRNRNLPITVSKAK